MRVQVACTLDGDVEMFNFQELTPQAATPGDGVTESSTDEEIGRMRGADQVVRHADGASTMEAA